MTAPTDRRTERLGLYLAYELAPTYPLALAMLNGQLRLFDGFTGHGLGLGHNRSDTTSTEAAVLHRERYVLAIDDIDDARLGVEIAVRHYSSLLGHATALPEPALEQPVCRQGQRQLGHAYEWSDDERCEQLPVKRGMCQRHYSQWYRKQAVLGLSTIHLYAPGRPA